MIYMWFTGINYYKLAVEKDRDSNFTTITTIWKSGLKVELFHFLPYTSIVKGAVPPAGDMI